MHTEIQVSLLRGRHILDHRAVRSGAALRVPRRAARQLDAIADDSTPWDDDVIVDFRAGEPLILLPDGVEPRGGDIVAESGRYRLRPGARGAFGLGDTTLLVHRAPVPKAAPKPRLPPEARAWIARAERPLMITLVVALVVEVVCVTAVHRRPDLAVDPPLDDEFVVSHPFHITPPKVELPAPEQRPTQVARPTTPKPAGAPSPGTAAVTSPASAPLVVALASLTNDPVFQPGLSTEVASAFRDIKSVDLTSTQGDPRPRTIEERPQQQIGMPVPGDTNRPGLVEKPLKPMIFPDPKPLTPEPGQDPDDVRAIAQQIRLKKFEIQGCYESSLKRNPSLAGKMVIQFEIGLQGTVDDVSFPAEQLAGDSVQECITEHARNWKLRPLHQHDSLTVAFPFVFAAAP